MIKRLNPVLKNTLRIIVFIIFSGLIFTPFSLAKDNTTNNDPSLMQKLSLNEKKQKPTKPKAAATKNSFKRFEITYEAIYLMGKFWEEAFIEDGLGAGVVGFADLKNKLANHLTSNTGVGKLAFYFTPKTYVEGAYGATYLNKKKYGYANMNAGLPGVGLSGEFTDQLRGKDIKFWSSDIFQNIYTNKKTGIAVDARAGYSDYKMHIHIDADDLNVSGTLVSGELVRVTRQLTGYHVGTRLKVPIRLSKFPKHPMLFKFDIIYTPILNMKGGDMNLLTYNSAGVPFTQPGFTCKGKGDALEIHTGMTFQITSFFGIEVAYNYYQFKLYKGRYEDVFALPTVIPGGIPMNADIKNTKYILHGPSLAAKIVF
ncbi:MAG: hypothetical protein PHU91_04445 [Candidatus Omnitrophica bacterium]|nr:hypothetical protein [Candidatus Omnitrophota bacterium]MDD5236892.1 hypothetical protein [Candidatus Omnitrophota bacterium]MDD5610671.1 hypothetical protein [Candidatus Omnitrophota bacterium]